MRFVLLGPPGAGKGTQAVLLAERFGIPHVATGDLLRAAVASGEEIGKRARQYMDAGELVPDGVVLKILRERLSHEDAVDGFVLDGFPRNEAQARALDGILADIDRSIDVVVSMEVSDEEIVQRISSRRSCPKCGRVYNLVTTAPARDEICDDDGTELVRRDDDRPEVVRRRLEVYHEETAPLIGYYERRGLLRPVDGTGDVADVSERIVEAVKGAGA